MTLCTYDCDKCGKTYQDELYPKNEQASYLCSKCRTAPGHLNKAYLEKVCLNCKKSSTHSDTGEPCRDGKCVNSCDRINFEPVNLPFAPEYFSGLNAEEAEKPSILPALKLSWLQWEIMAATGENKIKAYGFLGGIDWEAHDACFLCAFINGGSFLGCDNCIKWVESNCIGSTCLAEGSVYYRWAKDRTQENAQAMADFLHKKYLELSKDEMYRWIKRQKDAGIILGEVAPDGIEPECSA